MSPVDAAAVAQLVGQDPMFAHDEDGNPIRRERSCLCGRRYVQTLLSTRFMALVESRGDAAIAAFVRQIPDMYVPVHCPPCERHDIGNYAKRDAFRQAGGNPDRYDGDREAAD